jgi:hypothetical protein
MVHENLRQALIEIAFLRTSRDQAVLEIHR